MTEDILDQGPLRSGSPLRTPRAAAVAGIIFALLMATVLVLLRISVPPHLSTSGAWLTDSGKRAAVAVALNLVPFAGIAFLWFIGVVRDRVGQREDRFFATVFLGSGLLFVAMLFTAAAVSGGLIAATSSGLPDSNTLALARNVTSGLLNVYAMRMAAVFTLSTVTIARRTQIVSRWLTLAGLAAAVVLLIGIGISPWVELVFPAWIMALSVDILAARPRDVSGERLPGTGQVLRDQLQAGHARHRQVEAELQHPVPARGRALGRAQFVERVPFAQLHPLVIGARLICHADMVSSDGCVRAVQVATDQGGRKLALSWAGIVVARTREAPCCRSGSWRRSGRRRG
jgi:hypothetical protein